MTPASSPVVISTGLESLDSLLGGVRPGDTFLWLVEDLEDFAAIAGTQAKWAAQRRYTTSFVDFGSPELAELRSSRIHAEFAEGFNLSHLGEHLGELAQYPRSEPIFFFCDDPVAHGLTTAGPYLELMADVLPKFAERGHIAHVALSKASRAQAKEQDLRRLASLVIVLSREGGVMRLRVKRAVGKFSGALFQPHLLKDGILEPQPIRDHEAHAATLEVKARELYEQNRQIADDLTRYREQETTLSSVLENSAEAIITLDLSGYIQSWNKGAERIFEHTPGEALGKQFHTLVSEGFSADEEVQGIVDQLRTKTYIKNLIVPSHTKSGRKIYLDLTNSVLKTPSGKVLGIFVIMREITDRVLAERQLNRMVRELSVLRDLSDLMLGSRELEAILQVLLIGVTSGQGLRFNRAIILLVNDRRQSLEGRLAMGPADKAEAEGIWSALSNTGAASFQQIFQRYLKQPLPRDPRLNTVAQAINVPLNAEDHPLVECLNTTKGALLRKASSGEAMTALFEDLGAEELCAAALVSEGEALGLLIADNAINKTPISQADVDFLCLLSNHASSAVRRAYLHEELAQRLNDLERVTTELKANQERMLQFERLRTVGEMAARVAHEIRNPLAAVGGLARVLERKGGLADKSLRYVKMIIEEIARLELIVMEIQTFTKAAALRLEVLDIHEALRRAVEMAKPEAAKCQVAIHLDFDSGIPPISHDPDRMKQVFLNLIINACQAMENGGNVWIATSSQQNHVRIDIKDDGVGMAPETIERITEPFFTTKSTGSGLGVTIINQLIETHNGFLTYESAIGRGTTATVKLPLLTSAKSGGSFSHSPVDMVSSEKSDRETNPGGE